MKKESKARYKELFASIRNIINDIDPEFLDPGGEGGTPVDEYDEEAQAVLNFIVHNQEEIKITPQKLIDKINNIWYESFGSKCSKAEILAANLSKLIY